MPVATTCQVGRDTTDHDDSLSLMVQPAFHPTGHSLTQLAYKITSGIHVEYLAEVPMNNIHLSFLGH